MIILRTDYDKPHRCPAWSGPGYSYTDSSTCDGGLIDRFYAKKWWAFRIHRHDCGALILPDVLRWLEWRTWANVNRVALGARFRLFWISQRAAQ